MANSTKEGLTFNGIMKDLRGGQYKPIYLLMGQESFFIDRITDYMIEHVIPAEARDFNLVVLFGKDCNAETILDAARRYPVMAERQLVVVREAQMADNLEALAEYAKKPSPTTILVLCYKNGVYDRRRKLTAEIARNGVVFESACLRDKEMAGFVNACLKEKKLNMDAKCVHLMVEHIGNDLNRMASELDKLAIGLPQGTSTITADIIEQKVGISKQYNIFEFRSALARKDVEKANIIANFFNKNSNSNPIQMVVGSMFSFFSNLMLAYYAPNKTDEGVANWLGLRSAYAAKDYTQAMRMYSGTKVLNIISKLRMVDTQSKGGNNRSTSSEDLLRELVFYILH